MTNILVISLNTRSHYSLVDLSQTLLNPGDVSKCIQRINVGGNIFCNIFGEPFYGFYSGLRNEQGALIGIQLDLLSQFVGLEKEIPKKDFIELEQGVLSIFWGDKVDFKEGKNSDQSLGFSAVFKNNQNLLAVFDLSYLLDADTSYLTRKGLEIKHLQFIAEPGKNLV
jgi:hypothetical protein